MKNRRPVLVSFIADLNIFSCLLLLVTFFPGFVKRLGILVPTPDIFDAVRKVVMIIILSITTFGLLKLRKWGYWLMVAYHMIFLVISILLVLRIIRQEHFYQNLVPSIIGLYLIFSAKRYFIKDSQA